MKKYPYVLLFILIAALLASCAPANTQLQATNQALAIQVNTQSAQLTEAAGSPPVSQPTSPPAQQPQPSTGSATATYLPTLPPLPTPTALPTSPAPGSVPVALIFSAKGLISPWSNSTAYSKGLFTTANVHMTCGRGNPLGGSVWIDKTTYLVKCKEDSEGWTLWKPDITIGDHYIYSTNSWDTFEFWTVGTPPFTVKNRNAGDDFAFIINNAGEYQLSVNVVKGAFTVYITCEHAQNFTYAVNQSTTVPLVLNPANCELIIRDNPPGTLNPGEIEVSLAPK